VALTRAPENVDENHDISFEAPFTRDAARIFLRGGLKLWKQKPC